MIELCLSAANVDKKSVSTKCFDENFEVLKNIFFLVLDILSLMTLYRLWTCCNYKVQFEGIMGEFTIVQK